MLSVLHYSFNAVMPIIMLILVGVFARRTGYLDAVLLRRLNRFTFRFTFTAMMFVNIYEIDSIRDMPVQMVFFCLASLVVLFTLGVVLSGVFAAERFRRGVLIQSMFRSNYAIIGLPVSIALVGEAGGQMATFLQLPSVLLFNLLSVIVLSYYADFEAQYRLYGEGPLAEENASGQNLVKADPAMRSPAKTDPSMRSPAKTDPTMRNTVEKASAREDGGGEIGKMFRGVVKNPLLQGLFLGLIALLVRYVMPVRADGSIIFSLERDIPWLYSAISSLSRIATPLALIILGGQLEMSEIGEYKKELIAGVLMRLIGAPLTGFSMMFLAMRAGLLTVGRVEIAVLIALFASPQAVSSIVMSTEMGGDGHLAGQIVVWSSVLGMFSLFLIVFFFRYTGYL